MEYLYAGIGTGFIQAVIYNPYDKALFLSIDKSRNFFDKHNWINPFRGLTQSIFHRTLTGGIYFSIQSALNEHTNNSLTIGLVGGMANAVLLNHISVIKYNCWEKKITFTESISDLYKHGGFKIFKKGMSATITRDMVFCSVYEICRNKNNGTLLDEIYNLGVGITASILSSPFNYVRNVKYATPPHTVCRSDMDILKSISVNYRSLRIGWGTVRCSMGMVTGQFIYNRLLNTNSKVTTV